MSWALCSEYMLSHLGIHALMAGASLIRYIVGADVVHHLFLGMWAFDLSKNLSQFIAGDYKKAYPNAKLIAPEGTIERHGDPGLKFDGGGWSFTFSCMLSPGLVAGSFVNEF